MSGFVQQADSNLVQVKKVSVMVVCKHILKDVCVFQHSGYDTVAFSHKHSLH